MPKLRKVRNQHGGWRVYWLSEDGSWLPGKKMETKSDVEAYARTKARSGWPWPKEYKILKAER